MTERTLTSGQVSGLTGVPDSTLRRYASQFGDFLSEAARRPLRGKRFSLQDVKFIFWIRHMYFQRWKPEEIQKVLTGDKTCESLPHFEINDDLSISQATHDYMLQAEKYVKESRQIRDDLKGVLIRCKRVIDHYEKVAEVGRELASMKADIEYIKTHADSQKKKNSWG